MKHITSNKGEGMWWANEKAVMADKVYNRLLSTSLQWGDVNIDSQHPHPHSLVTVTTHPPSATQQHRLGRDTH